MTSSRPSENPYRLDRNIEPILYAIELEPDLSRFTFQGTQTIQIKAKKPFSQIVLHCLDIKVRSAAVSGADALHESAKAVSISYDEKREVVILDFGTEIDPGWAEFLDMDFSGELNDKMHGFYRTSYEVKGEKRWGAATQFEATDARRAFPCWDEPDFKAQFKVTLRVPNELTALSNMPVEEEKPAGPYKKKITYEVSPVMSTYLLAIVVADLESIEAVDKNGVLVRVFTTPGKKEQGRFSLDVALHTLPYFAEWFDIPYALPKCDMVALPDFASGAMENWGLVTYRETALLVDPVNSSAAARQRVAEVVDHELAHQWFGNLVTMEWWTDLWLNEGFASYMGPKAVAEQFPEWNVWDQYVVMEYMTALHSDALKNTHPIEIPVKHPSEIREIFDHITYSKGSVVNRMLEHYLGEEKFRSGLRVYLKKFAYRNAKTIDLWHALEEVSGKPVKSIMAGYTKQGGYPVVSETSRIERGRRVLTLEQKRFLFDGSKDTENLLWDIPVSIAAPGLKKGESFVMDKRWMEVSLPGKNPEWFKLNSGQSGFYRVAYSSESFDALTRAIANRTLSDSVIDYLGILDDGFALAKAGYIPTSKALEVLKSCKSQTDYNVWIAMASGLGSIDHIVTDAAAKKKLAAFALALLLPLTHKKGWEKKPSEKHTELLLRSLLISQAGYYGDAKIIQEAQRRFREFIRGKELEPNLRAAVYGIVARYGDSSDFDALVEIYKKSPLQEEKVRVLRALSRFRKKETIAKALAFSMSADVRNQDAYVVLASLGGNDEGREATWRFIKSNWKTLLGRYSGSSVTLLGRILEGASSGFLTQAALDDVKDFFKKNPVQGTERTMRQSIEVIQSNLRWAKRDSANIAEWLKSQK